MLLSDEASPRTLPWPTTLLIQPLSLEISPLCPVEIKALNPYQTQPKSRGTNLGCWNQPTSLQLYIIIAHRLGQREGKKGNQHLTCKPEGWCDCRETKTKTL